jgi:hypothetical protein
VPRAMIAETINVIAVLSGRGSQRRLAGLATVRGLSDAGDYVLTPAVPDPDTLLTPAATESDNLVAVGDRL